MMIAKIAGLAAAGSLCLFTFAAAALAADMRPATKAEIVKHLGPNATGKTNANGFTYKPGSTKGYKVTNGSICIRSPDGSTGCAKILTDGTKFKMVTAGGSRDSF
jgi:hypothetical protein